MSRARQGKEDQFQSNHLRENAEGIRSWERALTKGVEQYGKKFELTLKGDGIISQEGRGGGYKKTNLFEEEIPKKKDSCRPLLTKKAPRKKLRGFIPEGTHCVEREGRQRECLFLGRGWGGCAGGEGTVGFFVVLISHKQEKVPGEETCPISKGGRGLEGKNIPYEGGAAVVVSIWGICPPDTF